MNNIYEVLVVTETAEYVTKIFGLPEAVMECARAAECDNVLNTHVMDCETGEIMLHVVDGTIVWVSGLGDPREF